MLIVDYVGLLNSMDALFVQSAIIEEKLKPAPEKRKKLMFVDQFIYHAMRNWLSLSEDPFSEKILPIFNNPSQYSALVESRVKTHFRRFYSTYYIKSEGEVDIAYVDNKKFWPI